MTTSPDSPQLASSAEAEIAATLAEWAERDATIGLGRELDVVRSLKEQAELRLLEQGHELHAAKERVLELETFAVDLQIRLTEHQEVAASLRAELAAQRSAAPQAPGRLRALVRRVVRSGR